MQNIDIKEMTKPYFLWFWLFFVAGVILQMMFPVFSGFGWALAFLGIAACFGGGYLCVLAYRELDRFKALPVAQDNQPETIVTTGIYSHSRHPIYLGAGLIYIGVGLMFGNVWMLALFLPLFLVMNNRVTEGEEYNLCEKFGEDYYEYRKLVRKWF